MSNHHHTIVFDRNGNYPAFIHRFHELFAKTQNVLRGRWENFWSSEAPSIVRLVDVRDTIEKMTYVATNPVKAHLVSRTHHWPGVNGWIALQHDRVLTARRPHHFFRSHGAMPEQISLEFVVPPELGERQQVIREVAEQIAIVEANHDSERERTGGRIVGRRQVLRLPWRHEPTAPQARRGLNPKIAARDVIQRTTAIQEMRDFVRRYRIARQLMLRGAAVRFPHGTYWLRIHVGVETEPWIRTSNSQSPHRVPNSESAARA